MLAVGLVCSWVRWNWKANFPCFHWPSGNTVASYSLPAVEVPGEPFLGGSLNASPCAWQLFSSRQSECSRADFISCLYSTQPLSPLAHTAPYTSLFPKDVLLNTSLLYLSSSLSSALRVLVLLRTRSPNSGSVYASTLGSRSLSAVLQLPAVLHISPRHWLLQPVQNGSFLRSKNPAPASVWDQNTWARSLLKASHVHKKKGVWKLYVRTVLILPQ